MVTTPNLLLNPFSLLVRRLVAIPVATIRFFNDSNSLTMDLVHL